VCVVGSLTEDRDGNKELRCLCGLLLGSRAIKSSQDGNAEYTILYTSAATPVACTTHMGASPGLHRVSAGPAPSMHGVPRRTQSHNANLVNLAISVPCATHVRPPPDQHRTASGPPHECGRQNETCRTSVPALLRRQSPVPYKSVASVSRSSPTFTRQILRTLLLAAANLRHCRLGSLRYLQERGHRKRPPVHNPPAVGGARAAELPGSSGLGLRLSSNPL
jgi:hypothetical protein